MAYEPFLLLLIRQRSKKEQGKFWERNRERGGAEQGKRSRPPPVVCPTLCCVALERKPLPAERRFTPGPILSVHFSPGRARAQYLLWWLALEWLWRELRDLRSLIIIPRAASAARRRDGNATVGGSLMSEWQNRIDAAYRLL
jgi:hypothetical protein